MFKHTFTRPSGQQYCCTEYREADHWLQATWTGFITTYDGQCGATELLRRLHLKRIPYLLNDNSQVQGPWFDSIDWLERIWAPRAERLGLRYVAHVLQPHIEDGLGLLLRHDPFAGKFELQFFDTLPEARLWLRDCQRRDQEPPARRPATAPSAGRAAR